MKKIVLLFLLLAIGIIAFSQEITVRFTGQFNGTDYCRLDSVKVTNLTRNWTEIVEYPDTIIVLGGTVGTDLNIAATQGLGQNIPNPFDCETRVELSVSQREDVRMQLLDVAGKVYAEYNGSLDAGVHTFDISAANPQTYILNAVVGDKSYSIRMVNMGSGCGSSIKYAGVSGGIEAKLTTTNEFQIGDNMRYVGYATIDGQSLTSAAVEQAQYVSQYVTLHFVRNERPVVQTLAATEITSYSANLNGNVVSDGGATITARGFFYGTSADNMSNNVTVSAGSGEFASAIENLSAGATYYYCAYATNEMGTTMGEVLNFTTLQTTAPTVVTLDATNVAYTTAVLNGNLTSTGGLEITEKGFFYGTSADNLSQMATASTDFSAEVSGLNASTTYYFKAFATNANGTSFGELKTFTTLTMARPTVVTLAATNITITSATLNGSVTDNNASVTARGFQLGASENDLSVSLPVNTSEANFSMNIPGLDANTTYYFRAYATDEFGAVYGEVMDFTTSSVVAPTVSTLAVSEITYTTATLAGSITSDGGASVTECGFRYSTSPIFGSYETLTCQSVSSNFAYSLNGLNAGTTYYVKAYATNSIGTAFGEVQSFTTESYLAPAVTTLAASGITVASATLNGTVVSNGGAEITERGFVYSASPLFGTYSTITSNSETDSFSADIYELESSTTYYYKAYATNSVGTTYGEILNFTTLAIGNPSVVTYAATNVTYTSAVINAGVISDGGATITGCGFYWGTSEDNLTEQVTAGIGASNFNISLTDLTDNTTYFYKAYATNSAGTAYGNTLSFTTTEILAPSVETAAATEVTRVSAKLNGEITSDGGTDVTARGFIYSQYSNFTTYETVNTALTSNVFYVNVESLSPVTTYYFKAFATNSRGTTYGEALQFTTLEFYIPTVLTYDATDVTISSATLNGNITSDGGSTITAKGFQYGTSADNLTSSVTLGIGAGAISTTLSDLNDNTAYFYRAYASNTQGTAYGEIKSFTTVEIVRPSITTLPATNSTRTSLVLNASITSDGGAEVTARGFYWGTAENDLPNYVASEQTTADFAATISDLNVNTVYYYCAAATNIKGTTLGEVLSSRTNPLTAPTVVTNEATNVTNLLTATLNATITDDGGTDITARGFYWGTSADNLVNNAVYEGTSNNFSVNLTGLTERTTYYYCAYATNSTSTAIGETKQFTSLPQGAIVGEFSVSETTQVYFSHGNLQYRASTNTWQFAENQYDCIGSANSNISSTYTDWIDLFGWGTGSNPTDTSTSSSNYSTFTDWGNNAVSNGGNQSDMWRTLTKDEWSYLLNDRNNAASLVGKATVNGVTGLVFLPDNWTLPSECLFTSGKDNAFTTNTYTTSQWALMESAGAVFLPAAGNRYGTGVGGVYTNGDYWSSTARLSSMVWEFYFNDSNAGYRASSHNSSHGSSVRLIRVVQN